ncbi:MAG: exodeoxyribonuclease III [Bdellovibrionales bacterium]
MRLISWNVNGLRACARTGFAGWFRRQEADVVCLQEIKVKPEQLDEDLRSPKGYQSFWFPAEKPGYSGVAVYSRNEPLRVQVGLGHQEIDSEGRVLTLEFPQYYLVNAYFPNSQREHTRLPFKLEFCRKYQSHVNRLRATGKTVLMCADWNIAHKEVDLRNPKTNMKNAGFLPEERAWMTQFLDSGYIDCFRHFNQDPGHYTWWSYRPGVRERNIGWRLDYFLTDHESKDRLVKSRHHTRVMGSDHCPVSVELKS